MKATKQTLSLRLPQDLRWPPAIAGILAPVICALFAGPYLGTLLLITGIGSFLTGVLSALVSGAVTREKPYGIAAVIGLVSYSLCLAVFFLIHEVSLAEIILASIVGVVLCVLGSAVTCRLFEWKAESMEE